MNYYCKNIYFPKEIWNFLFENMDNTYTLWGKKKKQYRDIFKFRLVCKKLKTIVDNFMKKDPCKSTIKWVYISTPFYNKFSIKLTDSFMREFYDQIGPISITQQELSDDFIRDFSHKFAPGTWHNLSLRKLSPEILIEFSDKINKNK